MEDIDIPQYFLCPISLQIMKDPVTTITGITYDRESIEHWLQTAEDAACPVTKQPLPRDSDLTPNHMLRRLIQAWCTTNAKYGIDQIPTPKSPLKKSYIFKLIRDLKIAQFSQNALKKLDELANEDIEWNRKCMVEAGVTKVMVLLIIRCFKEGKTKGLEEALSILYRIWSPTAENKQLVAENNDLFESLTWVLRIDIDNHVVVKTHAVKILKMTTEVASSSLIGKLKLDFFMVMTSILRGKLSPQAIKAALHVLIQSCPWGTNRMKIIEAGAVFDVIELELSNPEKKTTELIFRLLAQLCSCADGRAELLKHSAGIAMLSKRTLRISAATDDRSMHIFAQITKFSATNEVLIEMLRVGAVSKLCMILQAHCEAHLKRIAQGILRLHSNVWNNSPCIQVYLLTRNAR
ncbi:E3 ubiquitin-protein ligase PUB24-like [Coffea eugenioides]|uniref:U-box domain-containing protein n=1 Tax=Coffea arabica TaxID=13443 RepID=A0A6P6TWS1_COFAR|nr:E3 ubiquitin-protein ligase PUB24-like [Coffea arabica]XP_027151457.1 E3 ubiquitin-protein ligase PUB24-like [Coffea eugenioides]